MIRRTAHIASLSLMFVVVSGLALSAACEAATYNLTPADDWFNLFNSSSLNPGDEVVLADGIYSHRSRLSFGHVGTAENPIIIRAAEEAKVVITRPTASQNVMDIEGAQYVTFRGLEVTGGSRGIRIREGSGRHPRSLTFEDMYVHHTGGGAFSANDNGSSYDGLVFRRNHVSNTVISQNNAISIGNPSEGSLSGPILIANNAFYTTGTRDHAMLLTGAGGITIAGNVGMGRDTPSQPLAAWQPSGDIDKDFGDIASMNAFPISGSALIGTGDPMYMTDVDFNGDANVDSADLNTIGTNWQSGVRIASVVLKPSGLVLLMSTLLLGSLGLRVTLASRKCGID